MKEKKFEQMVAYSAILAGLFALAYAYFFVIAKNTMMYSLFLLLLGVTTLEVMTALFGRLKNIHEGMARIAVMFGIIGAAGMAIHGGYDLANVINPPAMAIMANIDLPNQVDPRGLLTFGFLGFAITKISWLMSKDKSFPNGLVWVGYITGVLLIVIYIARLTILSPANPILLYPVLLNGFIFNPLWYLWLGYSLLKRT